MRRLASICGLLVVPGSALACSGPGAVELIGDNIRTAHVVFAVGIFIALGYAILSRRSKGWPQRIAPLIIFSLLNPALLASAYGGDCGYFKVGGSVAFAVALLVYTVGSVAIQRRRAVQQGIQPDEPASGGSSG